MNLTIKNIPEQVHKELKNLAAAKGRSLNTEVIGILSAEAAEQERRRQMRASRKDLERFVAGLPKLSSSAPLIREDRNRR